MPIYLHPTTDLPDPSDFDYWLAVTGTNLPQSLNSDWAAKRLPDLGHRLEEVFDTIGEIWWDLGRRLGANPTARFAHAPTAAAYICDLGLMLTWVQLVETLAADKATKFVVLCDDPWLYRQLEPLAESASHRRPNLLGPTLKLKLRGYLARALHVLVLARRSFAFRRIRPVQNRMRNTACLAVYAHPASLSNGDDAYFGPLFTEESSLYRVVHTDGDADVASRLTEDGRTYSLHAWGNPFFALTLIVSCWRPTRNELKDTWSWLLRRAVLIENSTAAAAANRWQSHCQDAWLKDQRPTVVAWPWENHPWERQLCRQARRHGIKTVGYQHAVIGPHQFNPSPRSNPDGMDSIPDRVVCSGKAYRDQLEDWGVPDDRLEIGGAFRIKTFDGEYYDPDGPVYVALSSITPISEEMLAAVRRAVRPGRRFLVKEHPLYPISFSETEDIQRTDKTIPESSRISALLYGTGTTGLEGLFAGLPTFRFRPSDRVAINVLPKGVEAIPVTSETLAAALDQAERRPKLPRDTVFTDPERTTWRQELGLDATSSATGPDMV